MSRERSTLAQTARSRACSHQQVACEGRSIRAHKGSLCRYFHDGRMHASTDGYRARVPVTMYAMLSPHSCNRYRVQCAYLVCLSSIPTFDETVLRSADITTIMSSKPENNACKTIIPRYFMYTILQSANNPILLNVSSISVHTYYKHAHLCDRLSLRSAIIAMT